MRSIALGAFLGQALLGSAVVGQQFTNTTTQIPVGSLNDQSYSGATSLPVGQGLYTTIIVNGQSTRVVVQSLGCKRVPAGVIPVTNSVTVAASSSSSCAAACLTTTRTTYAFFQNVCYCGTDVAPGLIDLPVSECAAGAPISKMRRQQTVNDIITILRGFFANQVAPVLVGDNTAGLVSNLDQPFSVISTLNPGQAILATLLNSNGQQQRFRLESLGCRQLGVGESPFSDSFSPIAADAPTCVTTCLGNTYPLSSFIRNTCFCGTTVRATGAPLATLAQCQNPTPGNDFGTVIRASAFGPAPTTTTTSRSSTSSSSSSSSSSTSSTSTSSTLTSTSSTSVSSTSTSSTSTSRTSTSLTTSSSSSITDSFPTDFTDFPTSTETSGSASPSSTASINPANVGGFTYLGCYRSPSSFPTFTLTLSAEVMTNDRCIAACPAGKRYAATFGNDCFCGDFIDDVNEPKTPEEQCNIPCPGNSGQRCGGRFTGPSVKAKRQLPGVIASDIRFTIYVRAGAVSGTVTGAVTTVVTAVTTGTAANGVITSGVVVVTTTVAAPGPWATGKWSNFPCFGDDCYKRIVAFGDYCGFDFPCFGPDCQRRLVWTNGVWRPEVCSGYDCGRKVKCISGKCDFVTKASAEYDEKIICYGNVCKVEKCESDECNKKYVCKDNSCVFESCSKEEANKKYVYEGGKYTVVKECDGTCPKPQPPCEGDKCNVVIPQPPITTVTYNGSSYNTVVIPQPPITKVPYQTAQPPAQTPVQPPANPPANPPASNGAQPPAASGAPGGGSAAKPPVVPVVTAGTSKFAASFGALAFSVIAAAVLL